MLRIIQLKDRPPRPPKRKAAYWRPLLIQRDGLHCHWCGILCDPDAHPQNPIFPTVDHVKRKADGGPNCLENFVLACRKCNNTRHSPYWSQPLRAVVKPNPNPTIHISDGVVKLFNVPRNGIPELE